MAITLIVFDVVGAETPKSNVTLRKFVPLPVGKTNEVVDPSVCPVTVPVTNDDEVALAVAPAPNSRALLVASIVPEVKVNVLFTRVPELVVAALLPIFNPRLKYV